MSAKWILAQADTIDGLAGSWRSLSGSLRDFIMIFGAVALVTAAVIIWAVFFRKRRRHHHEHSRHHSRVISPGDPLPDRHESEDHGYKHGRRRRRHRHRPRNPTLAETGGLPPVRPERSPEPFP